MKILITILGLLSSCIWSGKCCNGLPKIGAYNITTQYFTSIYYL